MGALLRSLPSRWENVGESYGIFAHDYSLLKGRSMPSSGLFSGPPSNKATASTFAVAIGTLFWTIAAHTFWKAMSTADMTLYITTSTVILTAIVGFLIPESAAYTQHNSQRLATQAATR